MCKPTQKTHHYVQANTKKHHYAQANTKAHHYAQANPNNVIRCLRFYYFPFVELDSLT